MKTKKLFSVLVLFVLLSYLSLPVSAETLVFSGSSTVQKRILEPNVKAIRESTGIRVGIKAVGSGRGFQDLLDGKFVASIVSTSLKNLLVKKGLEDDGTYRQHTIVDDVISPARCMFPILSTN